jgi:hypothetical protein
MMTSVQELKARVTTLETHLEAAHSAKQSLIVLCEVAKAVNMACVEHVFPVSKLKRAYVYHGFAKPGKNVGCKRGGKLGQRSAHSSFQEVG